MKYCGRCGAQMADDQSVCMKCGCASYTDTNNGGNSYSYGQPANNGGAIAQTVKKSSSANKLIVIFIILLIAVLTGRYIYVSTNGGKVAIKQLDKAVQTSGNDYVDMSLVGEPSVLSSTKNVYYIYAPMKVNTTIGTYEDVTESGMLFIVKLENYFTGQCRLLTMIPVKEKPDSEYLSTWKSMYDVYAR